MLALVSTEAPPDWDGYVDEHVAATAYHRAKAVAVGADAFGLKTFYLTARDDDGVIRGVLPLVEQSSFLFGRFLVSLPFVTYGGILADDGRATALLAAKAGQLAQERNADHAELRHAHGVPGLSMAERLDKVSMVLELPQTETELSKRLGSKLRSQIRRADRELPEVVWGGIELLREFHLVFCQSMHSLGTPIYPLRFFEVVCRALEERARIVVVRIRGRVEAAAITVRHPSGVEVPWAAATAAAKRTALNMRMYWEMLSTAAREGSGRFDFGRSSIGSGTYKFKAQWGAEPRQLHWHYWLPANADVPMLNHSNPKYAVAIGMWRRMPLWLANLIGPHIIRHLP